MFSPVAGGILGGQARVFYLICVGKMQRSLLFHCVLQLL
jgi:hypothetical protein